MRTLPRVTGSTLTYPDHGKAPETYLGGAREVGWTERDNLPARPRVRSRRKPVRRRFSSRHRRNQGGLHADHMSKVEYDASIALIREVAERALPQDATVLVVSKGDEQLLELGARAGRHFPSVDGGDFAGFHPPDDAWAIEHLEELRGQGAGYLLFPASAFWWLEHYSRFAEYLQAEYEPVAAEEDACLIFDLGSRSSGDTKPADPTMDLIAEADSVLGEAGQHRRFWQRFHPDPDADETLPRFAVAAEGYEFVDSSGRKFLDWVSGGGPVILGYRHAAVEEAIRSQFAAGPTLSLPHPIQLEVARMLIEMIPCAEMVAFGKNGSDAVTAAVRIARAVTGREMILQYGIHGFHDWHTCARPGVQGVPKALRSMVQSFPYNDLEALQALFDRYDGEVAGIVMEPVTQSIPAPGYLESVLEMAHAHGALLIFDEMVTGFRLATARRTGALQRGARRRLLWQGALQRDAALRGGRKARIHGAPSQDRVRHDLPRGDPLARGGTCGPADAPG